MNYIKNDFVNGKPFKYKGVIYSYNINRSIIQTYRVVTKDIKCWEYYNCYIGNITDEYFIVGTYLMNQFVSGKIKFSDCQHYTI